MKIGIVVPHIFMHEAILPHVIFSPGKLAIALADGLSDLGEEVTLFTPGPIATRARNITADLSCFEQELAGRGDTYMDLLKKHPFTFVTLARQVQSEMIAKAYALANSGELDIVHVYTNEEDTALPFAALCTKPVVFTHHDPFNFLVKYKNIFPKYKHLNWLSMSYAQRNDMPADTNWVGNIYHGLDPQELQPVQDPAATYIAYLGRIIESKGVHLAISAVRAYNAAHTQNKLTLKIAGKHYAGHKKDIYWEQQIKPRLDQHIEYVGFISDTAAKQEFLGNARALIIPSVFAEPFGMVMIEALACGTPLIGLDSGAIPEVVEANQTGILVKKTADEVATVARLAMAIEQVETLDRRACRAAFEARFTTERMCREHADAYRRLIK